MNQYKCTICGYIYDEQDGDPDNGILPGTIWASVPDQWACPLCGAGKSDFQSMNVTKKASESPTSSPVANSADTLEVGAYSTAQLALIFSNLSKGCEKQYNQEASDLFLQLSNYYKGRAALSQASSASFEGLLALVEEDLEDNFARANAVASSYADRGSLRALKWAEKVSHMLKSHLKKAPDNSLAQQEVYVCDICGFMYIGDECPEICPVCKVPSMKMTQIQRRA